MNCCECVNIIFFCLGGQETQQKRTMEKSRFAFFSRLMGVG